MSFEAGSSGPAYTTVICDVCGHAEEYADGRVYKVSDMATTMGWSILSNDHALCPDCDYASEAVTTSDDEGEQFLRDREIDARVSPIGELHDWDVLP